MKDSDKIKILLYEKELLQKNKDRLNQSKEKEKKSEIKNKEGKETKKVEPKQQTTEIFL